MARWTSRNEIGSPVGMPAVARMAPRVLRSLPDTATLSITVIWFRSCWAASEVPAAIRTAIRGT